MIDTRLTRTFGLTCPVVLAPMEGMAGGHLAAAVTCAGGLGVIGTGTPEWTQVQLRNTRQEAVGVGFLAEDLTQDVLTATLIRKPRAIYLSQGDPRPFAKMIHDARVRLICQVQNMEDARRAVEAGAHVVVAQGAAAGGDSGPRSTLSLVPEVADYLYVAEHDTLLLAAGGIADARGLAAAIVMGADGVVMGTRFLATQEAKLSPGQIADLIAATGDDTHRVGSEQRVLDGSSGLPLGEGVGLIGGVPSVAEVLETLSRKAERLLTHAQRRVIS